MSDESKRSRRATLREVARQIGVSPSTVSRVLNNGKDVSSATRRRVSSALQELGYSPSPLAAGLRRGQVDVIHLLFNEVGSYFISAIMAGIESAAYRSGYRVLVSSVDFENTHPVPDQLAASVICLTDPVQPISLGPALLSAAVPVVCAYGYDASRTHPSVMPDDRDGAYKATAHLVARGCRHVVHVAGRPDWDATIRRINGYRQAMADGGCGGDCVVEVAGDYRAESGRAAMRRLFDAGRPIDGVFAGSDHLAVGVYRAAQERGLSIPGDLSVMGFDNKELCDLVEPRLSSVAMPLRAIGARAVEIVLQEVSGKRDEPESDWEVFLPCQVVLRESVR